MAHPSLRFVSRLSFAVVISLLLLSCPSPLSTGSSASSTGGGSSTGEIDGHALYTGQSDSSGIVISSESTDSSGKTVAVKQAVSKGGGVRRAITAQATTDATGAYKLTGLAAGTYTIYASSPNSLEKAVTTGVTVVAGKTAIATDLSLTPTGQITGKATLNGATSGDLGIVVYIAGTSFSAITDDGGSYTMSSVPTGTGYTLVASSSNPGFDSAITSVNVTEGAKTAASPLNLPVHVTLASTGTVAGTAELNGATSGNAGIFVYLSGTSFISMSDDAGDFSLAGVAPGAYTLVASKEGYDSSSIAASVSAGNTTNIGTFSLSTPSQVTAPRFTPGPGQYSIDQSVAIRSATSGATIYYTLNNSDPTTSSAVYSAPIAVPGNGTDVTIKALAVKPGMTDSLVTTGTYTINYNQVATPVFDTVTPGRFSWGQLVTLSSSTPGVGIRYTTDGSRPNAGNGSTYLGPITVAVGTSVTIKAYAYKSSMADSEVLMGTFVVDPIAYVANSGSNNVSTFTIDPISGALTSIGATASPGTPGSVAVDPTGKFAYVANTGSLGPKNVSAYTIDPISGALTAVVGSPFAGGQQPFSVTVDPSGRFAYVANAGISNNVWAYSINPSTGALTSIGAVLTGGRPRSVTVDPTGKFAYVATGGASNNVWAYSIDPGTGALTSLGAVTAGTDPYSVTVDPTGKFAYVANSGSGTVSAYTIDPGTGALTSVGDAVAAGTNPASVTVDPTGKFAYAANWTSSTVSAYTISPVTGALTSVGAAVATGVNPFSVTVDPTGKFAYVANSGSNNVSAYAINPGTGALTSIGAAVAVGTNPTSIAIVGHRP